MNRHGRLEAAAAKLRTHLLRTPNDLDALAMLGGVYVREGRWRDAETLFAHALEAVPDSRANRFSLANALFLQQKAPQGLAEINRLLEADPANPAYRNLQAACLALIGDHAAVNRIYEDLLATYGRQPKIWLNYGHSLRAVGRQEEAVAAYRRSIALAPGLGEAYWSLANLKTYRFTDEELERMRAAEAAPTTTLVNRYHLCFALGKAYEDAGAYAESWRYYERGNALKRAESRYRPELLEQNTVLQKQVCTPAFFAARRGTGVASDAPILILGLPRAGSDVRQQS